jgi:mono/diheme cytochrome c family protein
MRAFPICLSILLLATACADENEGPVARGERVYRANCIACHNMDPVKDGVMGPPVAGSSQELLEARVLSVEYPPGYRPKRETSLMQPMPYLRDEIPALAAYLAGGGTQ